VTEEIQITSLVTDTLEALEIAYFITGSFASTAYGSLRTTKDADIVADMASNKVDAFAEALAADFYLNEPAIHDAIRQRTGFNLIHLESAFKVDIFLPKNRPHDRRVFKRRVKRKLAPDSIREVFFASPEDTILAKLEWYRMGGEVSQFQWQDVQNILLQRKERLDINYLEKSAAELELTDLLKRSLGENQG